MDRACIISTYPKAESQNVGDKLIEETTKSIMDRVLGISRCDVIGRSDGIEHQLDTINSSRMLVFACLAVRRNMFPRVYRLPEDISAIRAPMFAIGSGTSLTPSECEESELGSSGKFDNATVTRLRALTQRFVGTSCRGELTFNILRGMKLNGLEMTGDVALWDPRFDHLVFQEKKTAKSIAISAPLNPRMYAEHFRTLVTSVRQEFPSSQLHVMLHGKSPWLDRGELKALGCEVHDIYLDGVPGLDLYADMDVHIGYRVHAHVSALKRRVPSYLFAIDGRGMDYGRTLCTGTAVKAWRLDLSGVRRVREIAKSVFGCGASRVSVTADLSGISYLVDLLRRDAASGFSRFIGFERTLLDTSRRLESFVRRMGSAVN